ncbi:putative EF-hand domain-containing protein [Helianthus debilis subsp. tardiflorus]
MAIYSKTCQRQFSIGNHLHRRIGPSVILLCFVVHYDRNLHFMCRIYEGLDVNHDGNVSNAELKTLILGIQLQEDGKISDDLVQKIMDQLDISGDEIIQEDEFVRILTKWVKEARKSGSQNDYSPLRFFIKKTTNGVTFYLAKLKLS